MQGPGVAVDRVCSQTTGIQPSDVQESALRIETKGPGHRFGQYVSNIGQLTGGCFDLVSGDAVVSPVWGVQEFA